MTYDVVIAGGGPAGLSAALTLGRGRKRVLLCDAGERRNAAAEEVHNFVTRDGTPPAEFRRIGREQLARYPNVELCDERIAAIAGEHGAFAVRLGSREVSARRILLCTGMVDQPLELEGFREAWGRSVFQCPYCHGWEVQDRRFGYLATSPDTLGFALLLRGWARHVVLFTQGIAVPAELRLQLELGGIPIEQRPIRRLVTNAGRLEHVELADGGALPLEVLFVHPKQRQVPLIEALGLSLDGAGYVQVDEQHRETSIRGIYAAGDLVTPLQSAVLAAASGSFAASKLNHELTVELVTSGAANA